MTLHPLCHPPPLQVNRAEAEFWKRSAGFRLGYSDQLLGFDCGGQQWVLEVRQWRVVTCTHAAPSYGAGTVDLHPMCTLAKHQAVLPCIICCPHVHVSNRPAFQCTM